MKQENEVMVYEDYIELVKNIDKFSEAPNVSVNPFSEKLVSKIKMKWVNKGAKNSVGVVEMVNKSTGEVTSGLNKNTVFSKREYKDNDSFVKFYVKRFRDMFDLSHAAFRVFGYFVDVMQEAHNANKDMIYFNVKDCMIFCKYTTHPSVYTGLTELLKHGFIAKSDKPNMFWIDSTVAFNGDRILILEEHVRVRDDQDLPKLIKNEQKALEPNKGFDKGFSKEFNKESDW